MNDILQEINTFNISLVILGLVLVFRLRKRAIQKSKFFRSWRAFANETGFDLTSESFRNPFGKIGPMISGDYQGKKVKVTASYLGIYGPSEALINFWVLVDNPGTATLPAGAFLAIRKDSRNFGFWRRFRKYKNGKKAETQDLQDQFQLHGIPKNIGNFIFRQKPTEKLIQIPGMLDLHIDRENLSYSLITQIDEGGFLRQTLEDLSELATSFDRFVKNWI